MYYLNNSFFLQKKKHRHSFSFFGLKQERKVRRESRQSTLLMTAWNLDCLQVNREYRFKLWKSCLQNSWHDFVSLLIELWLQLLSTGLFRKRTTCSNWARATIKRSVYKLTLLDYPLWPCFVQNRLLNPFRAFQAIAYTKSSNRGPSYVLFKQEACFLKSTSSK